MKRIFNGSGGRKAALILSLCLIFALAVGTTVALLVAHTNAVTNTFNTVIMKVISCIQNNYDKQYLG